MKVSIRPARAGEAGDLFELAVRSKGHWPYDRKALEFYRPQLELHESAIDTGSVFVAEEGRRIVGFYALSDGDVPGRLEFFFVEPAQIGRGVGRFMWTHLIDYARSRGGRSLEFYSDRYAEGFYRRLGCSAIGSLPSILGPLTAMQIDL